MKRKLSLSSTSKPDWISCLSCYCLAQACNVFSNFEMAFRLPPDRSTLISGPIIGPLDSSSPRAGQLARWPNGSQTLNGCQFPLLGRRSGFSELHHEPSSYREHCGALFQTFCDLGLNNAGHYVPRKKRKVLGDYCSSTLYPLPQLTVWLNFLVQVEEEAALAPSGTPSSSNSSEQNKLVLRTWMTHPLSAESPAPDVALNCESILSPACVPLSHPSLQMSLWIVSLSFHRQQWPTCVPLSFDASELGSCAARPPPFACVVLVVLCGSSSSYASMMSCDK